MAKLNQLTRRCRIINKLSGLRHFVPADELIDAMGGLSDFDITIKVSEAEWRYLKALPIHHSQAPEPLTQNQNVNELLLNFDDEIYRISNNKKTEMKKVTGILAAMILVVSCANQTTEVNHADYQTNNIETMQKVYDFIKQECSSTYFIATSDAGQPRVRPFGTINIFEGKLYIQTGHKKDVAKQIAANPKVELCCFNGKADWLRLSGTLVEDDRVEAKKAMLDAYPNLRGTYDENDENTAVYYFKDATARFDSFVNAQEIEQF